MSFVGLVAMAMGLLQAGTETGTPITAPLDDYTSGSLLDAVLSDLVAALGGEALFAVLLVGVIDLAYWLAGGRDLATPAVFTILVGAMAFPLLPGQFISLARALIVLGGASLVLELARRYVLDPGTR